MPTDTPPQNSSSPNNQSAQPPKIGVEVLTEAEKVLGLEFTDEERLLMLEDVGALPDLYADLRAVPLENSVPPALYFTPRPIAPLPTRNLPASQLSPKVVEEHEELAFLSVRTLAERIKSRQITSLELTQMYIDRLKRYGPQLECVITLTEELALEQARRADAEIAAGHYRGPLHGIPWGAKDLLATRNIPTTWGAQPFREQIIDRDATVVQKLAEAGAVLVAKLSMGALAWGDVWFGGTTRSPWNLEEGSSGSSAGSGAATAAGLVGFAIGTETHGSIISPCTQCGVSGLRPTFGRVSRAGAMALCWSLDKIGPICRTVDGCALVFDAIYGPDGEDMTVVDEPFAWPQDVDLTELRIGYTKSLFEQKPEDQDESFYQNGQKSLEQLRALGATLQPIELPDYPEEAMSLIVMVEAAAAFDELTRSNRDDELVRQVKKAWPNRFRAARFVSAVEYIQANRIRTKLIERMAVLMNKIDLYIVPTWGKNLLLTNLTGHPTIVVPNGFRANGLPTSITFTGRLYDEAILLGAVDLYQKATKFHQQHPPLFTNL